MRLRTFEGRILMGADFEDVEGAFGSNSILAEG